MKYRATLTIEVDGAEIVDSDYLYEVKRRAEDYLGFEGEQVTVTVETQLLSINTQDGWWSDD